MSKESSSTKAGANGGGPEDSGVDAIREVLLGDRLRMYEQRFELLDKTVQSEREALRDGFEQRLSQLEVSMKDQFAQMTEAMESERKARADEVKAVVGRMDQSSAQFREQLQKLGGDHQAFKSESQREALALSKNLFKELQDSCANLNAYVERESSSLAADKASRSDVAKAMQAVAASLFPEGKDAKAEKRK